MSTYTCDEGHFHDGNGQRDGRPCPERTRSERAVLATKAGLAHHLELEHEREMPGAWTLAELRDAHRQAHGRGIR